MDDGVFRWILLALGSCIIIAVLVHGIWTSRKNSQSKLTKRGAGKPQLQPSGWHDDELSEDDSSQGAAEFFTRDDDKRDIKIDFDVEQGSAPKARQVPGEGEFDDLGVGAVRIVSAKPSSSTVAQPLTDSVDDIPSLDDFEPSKPAIVPEVKPVSTGKVYASVVSQPKPEYAAKYGNGSGAKSTSTANTAKPADEYQAPEPPPFLLKKDEPTLPQTSAVDMDALKKNAQQTPPLEQPKSAEPEPVKPPEPAQEKVSLAEQARQLVMGKKADIAGKKRREPKIAEDQLRIDFEDEPVKEAAPASSEPKAKPAEIAQEVLVLNVKAAEGHPIQGAALLPMLLTLGFKFGDQDIFHRHVNANGKGPVLFSLANMFKPGNFDIDNLENFTTLGISLFMILPIEGDPHQVFNMMHNAARKIADEFSAHVYDGRRALLTKQSLQQYVEKIREFERKRMVNRQ
ncbi:MAG: cell division protein ZipA [Paraglaciecola sp.]|nr:cell division protein ZipA [Paraglaciecola sp.]